MPSAFAHALVGASLSTVLPRRIRPTGFVLWLAALAAAPDIDVVAFAFGIPYLDPVGHRGFSHSLPLAAFVGALSVPLWRRAGTERSAFAGVLTFLALASHGLLDTFTDAGEGVGLLIPFENGRYFAPWRPIRTSPLDPARFFDGRGLAVLSNEAFWVGLPSLVFLTVAALVKRSDAKRKRHSDPPACRTRA